MSATLSSDGRAASPHVGCALRRKEDPRMVRGRGRYIDDIVVPGMLHAATVRSPEAHAKIASIDTSAAVARDEVVAVLPGRIWSATSRPRWRWPGARPASRSTPRRTGR
jgi:aerobic carbon-monoxide dehydrogenase large subunit